MNWQVIQLIWVRNPVERNASKLVKFSVEDEIWKKLAQWAIIMEPKSFSADFSDPKSWQGLSCYDFQPEMTEPISSEKQYCFNNHKVTLLIFLIRTLNKTHIYKLSASFGEDISKNFHQKVNILKPTNQPVDFSGPKSWRGKYSPAIRNFL